MTAKIAFGEFNFGAPISKFSKNDEKQMANRQQ